MSQRTKYRKEVSSRGTRPSDGDQYCIAVLPPLNQDDVYCRISCEGRNWGGSARAVADRDAAIDHIQDRLDTIERKATDDRERGSVPYYPEPPKPANTGYVVHPDYDGEIGPREIWGDATLASFGVETDSKFEDRPWYLTRDTYDEWLAPLREEPGSLVCRAYTKYHSDMCYWWYIAVSTDEGVRLQLARYRPGSSRCTVEESSWTSATRRTGGIGIIFPKPADCRLLPLEETPFADGTSEETVATWLDRESPDPLSTGEANQLDEDQELPSPVNS